MVSNFITVLHEIWLSGLSAIATYVLLFPVRTMAKTFGERVKKALETLDAVHSELTVQRTNCLTTLQREGEKQTAVLEKISGTLETIHVDQARTLGIMEGRRNGG